MFNSATHGSHTFESVTSDLFKRRAATSSFLTEEEWEEIESVRHLWKHPELISQISQLRKPWLQQSDIQTLNVIVVDARALQGEIENGTSRHALAMAKAIVESLPAGFRVAVLTDPDLPPLRSGIFADEFLHWRPALLTQVKVFVQLATVLDPTSRANLDLLRAPWIFTISVFLDDIQGMYPHHFVGDQYSFWVHQLAIEKLKRSEIILALSQTSQAEALAIWSSLPFDFPRPEFLISSCVSALPMRLTPNATPAQKSGFLVSGNDFPHKNLALASAASKSIHEITGKQVSLCFISSLADKTRLALVELARNAGSTQDSIASSFHFNNNLTDDDLQELLSSCEGIIVPSLHEGFSLPVVEAIEWGVPVLLSRIPAHQELLPEGPWFFDPLSVSSLVEAMISLSTNRSSWVQTQFTNLTERYNPSQLKTTVATALTHAIVQQPDTSNIVVNKILTSDALDSASGILSCNTDKHLDEAHKVLIRRDADFMAELLESSHSFTAQSVEFQTRKRVLRESRNWRLGNSLTAPILRIFPFIRWFIR